MINLKAIMKKDHAFKVDKIKWDATYNGEIANINMGIDKNGEKSKINMILNNEDLAKIFNISSVNEDLHRRLKNDYSSITSSNPIKIRNPLYIELNKEKDDINTFHKNTMKKYTPKNIKYLNNNSKKYLKKNITRPKTLRLQFKKHKITV